MLIFLFSFSFLHHLSFVIHIRSLTEVTATQWGVLRMVVLQGMPERVILLMGSLMRSRYLRPAHLFALRPSRRTAAAAAALDTAQVCEKFSQSPRLGCTLRCGLKITLLSLRQSGIEFQWAGELLFGPSHSSSILSIRAIFRCQQQQWRQSLPWSGPPGFDCTVRVEPQPHLRC